MTAASTLCEHALCGVLGLPVGKAGDGIILQMQGHPSRPYLARSHVEDGADSVSKRKEAKVQDGV